MAETKFFDEATAADFERREIPSTGLHPDFRRTGGGSCVVHVFRRRPESLKMHRENRRRKEKHPRQGDGGDEDDEKGEGARRRKGKKAKTKR